MTVKLHGLRDAIPDASWCYSVENHEDLNRRLLDEIAAAP